MHKRFLVLTFLLLAANASASEPPDIQVKAEVDKAFITIGERVNFRVTVIYSPDFSVLDFDATEALRDFTIKKKTDFSTKESGLIRRGSNYELTNYTLGEYVIRPVTVNYRKRGEDLKEILTASLYVTVQSIGAKMDADSDIRDAKGILAIKGPLWPWIALLVILSTVGGALLWKIVREKKLDALRRAQHALTPDEEAYQALNALKHSDYLGKSQYKLYFFEMSEILRRYFERRFHIHALESTTVEVMKSLKSKVSLEDRNFIQHVLDLCDFVKFAKYQPEVKEILKQNKDAMEIVDRTKVRPIETDAFATTATPELGGVK